MPNAYRERAAQGLMLRGSAGGTLPAVPHCPPAGTPAYVGRRENAHGSRGPAGGAGWSVAIHSRSICQAAWSTRSVPSWGI